jgi:hypothetical protein
VLAVRRDLARNRVPTVPGGGTIAFVDPVGHRYLDDPVAREEGGTPAIVESIRAGLVVALKQAVGTDLIQAREQRFLHRALDRWRANLNLELLGNLEVPRLPIVSFRVRHGDRHLHHELVVAMLNDLFGIQARGGCSCAGPYGHRLLGIGPDRSRALSEQAVQGWFGIKPGWVRLSFNYFISDAVADFLVEAVDLLGRHGHRLLGDYAFDPRTGHWRHHQAPPEPAPSLPGLLLAPPDPVPAVGEDALPGYLTAARAILTSAPPPGPAEPPWLPPSWSGSATSPCPPCPQPGNGQPGGHGQADGDTHPAAEQLDVAPAGPGGVPGQDVGRRPQRRRHPGPDGEDPVAQAEHAGQPGQHHPGPGGAAGDRKGPAAAPQQQRLDPVQPGRPDPAAEP